MTDQRDDPQTASWHFDKRIPVALIAALALQGGIFAFWMGALDRTVNTHEARLVALERLDDKRDDEMLRIEGRLSSLEATSKAQLRALERIEELLSSGQGGSR